MKYPDDNDIIIVKKFYNWLNPVDKFSIKDIKKENKFKYFDLQSYLTKLNIKIDN